MKRSPLHSLRILPYFALAALVYSFPTLAADGVLATVNGKSIPQSYADRLISDQLKNGAEKTPEMEADVRGELINRELLSQAAAKDGLDKQADVQEQIEFAKTSILVNAYIAELLKKNPVTDKDVKAEYDRAKANRGGKEYKARHILVEDKAKARVLIVKLNKGEDFAELAKESIDPGSKDSGGDLGWSPASRFIKPFADALTKMKKGSISKEPVATKFGYHVIKLEDVRDVKIPPLEEVREQIVSHLNTLAIHQHLDELRSKASIK